MQKLLITGTNSGFGRYLHSKLGGEGFDLPETVQDLISHNTGFETIIHCAFNTGKISNKKDLAAHLADNMSVTQKLISIPHNHFVFISSADVYKAAKGSGPFLEDSEFNLNQPLEPYVISKLACESLVEEGSKQYTILRPTGLFGRGMRRN